jgi:tetratricopeptide (TPR) repeat protein
MADVFVSYSRTDREHATRLAERLRGEGWTVWWDWEILAGDDYYDVIERELQEARVVVVLWSQVSRSSGFVRDEARIAKDQSKLIPVRLDDSDPALGFGSLQTISFSGWDGQRGAAAFQSLTRAIGQRLRGAPPAPPTAAPSFGRERVAPPPDRVERPPAPQPSKVPDDAAVRMLREALKEAERGTSTPDDPQILRALLQFGDYLRRVGRDEEALDHYRRAEQIGGGTRLDIALAESLEALGRIDDALPYRVHLAERSDDVEEIQPLVTAILDRVFAVIGDEGRSPGERLHAGREQLRQATRLASGWPFNRREWPLEYADALRPRFARALVELAGLSSGLGRHQQAVDLFEDHLEATTEDAPEWPAALEQLAFEYIACGDEAQMPGTANAQHEALAYYEPAVEIFEARGSAVGLRTALQRCALSALALDDMEAFTSFSARRAAAGGSDESDLADIDLAWPLIRLEVVAIDVTDPAREGDTVTGIVRCENRGSLSWRATRPIELQIGVQRRNGSSSTLTIVTPSRRIPAGGHDDAVVHYDGVRPGAEGQSLFAHPAAMPWERWVRRVSCAIPI